MADFKIDASYKEVPERMAEFFEKYPEGSFQTVGDPQVIVVGDKTFLAYKCAAYRTPDDERPGIAMAWEPVPGTTPYTKNSELMNAETSAWGRAIIAIGASTAKKIASATEVRNRQAEQSPVARQTAQAQQLAESQPDPSAGITPKQKNEIVRRLAKNHQITEDPAIHGKVTEILGKPVQDLNDMGVAEASKVIDAL